MAAPGFQDFYPRWFQEEKSNLRDLRLALSKLKNGNGVNEDDFRVLVERVYDHWRMYKQEKVKAAHENTAYVAAGLWRTPLEMGFIWLSGWRPTTAVVLAYALMGMQMEAELNSLLEGVDVPSMAALSSKQLNELNELQKSTKKREDELSNRLSVLQMLMGDEDMAKVTAQESPPSEGQDLAALNEAMDRKLAGLRDLLIAAETLRLNTLRAMLDILTPIQGAQYLVAALELTVSIRRLGAQRMQSEQQQQKEGKGFQAPPSLAAQSSIQMGLHEAAASGNVQALQDLLDYGANASEPDFDGRTPIHQAAARGHEEAVKLLVDRGADVNERDEMGSTPLLDAIRGGHENVAQTLRQRGASTSLAEVGSELCKFAASGDIASLRRLVEGAGVSPSTTDYDQRTPLHVAAVVGQEEAVDFLLQAGADLLAKDRHGYTALEEAQRSGKEYIAQKLLAAAEASGLDLLEVKGSGSMDMDVERPLQKTLSVESSTGTSSSSEPSAEDKRQLS